MGKRILNRATRARSSHSTIPTSSAMRAINLSIVLWSLALVACTTVAPSDIGADARSDADLQAERRATSSDDLPITFDPQTKGFVTGLAVAVMPQNVEGKSPSTAPAFTGDFDGGSDGIVVAKLGYRFLPYLTAGAFAETNASLTSGIDLDPLSKTGVGFDFKTRSAGLYVSAVPFPQWLIRPRGGASVTLSSQSLTQTNLTYGITGSREICNTTKDAAGRDVRVCNTVAEDGITGATRRSDTQTTTSLGLSLGIEANLFERFQLNFDVSRRRTGNTFLDRSVRIDADQWQFIFGALYGPF